MIIIKEIERRLPVLESARKIPQICAKVMENLYGDPHPGEIGKRLSDELESITRNCNETIYMMCKLLVNNASQDGRSAGTRGAIGSSFTAFLLGITGVNPLRPHSRCMNCKHIEFVPGVASGYDLPDKPCPICKNKMVGDGHGMAFEIFSR